MEVDKLERIQEILSQTQKEISSIEVSKNFDYDLGHLAVFDKDEDELPTDTNEDTYLKSFTRDAVQGLLNTVWECPQVTMDNVTYATLPAPTYRLPREKKVPAKKALTKWERFANEKGIVKKKKEKNVWDKTLKEWVPAYGMKRKIAEKKKNWVMEVPDSDPFEDQFGKKSAAKKERMAKNEYKRLRNIAKTKNVAVPNVGIVETKNPSKSELQKSIASARISTASLGKYQKTLPNEKKLTSRPLKRKREPETLSNERASSLKILEQLYKPELQLDKAVQKQVAFDNMEASKKPRKGENSHRRSKMGGRTRGASEMKARTKGMADHGTKRKKSLPAKMKPSKFEGVVGTTIGKKKYNSSLNKVMGIKTPPRGKKKKGGPRTKNSKRK